MERKTASSLTVPTESDGGREVGPRLRAERARQKIGVRELAKRVGVSASLISQIETGKSRPSVSTLYAIVTELGISLDELFADDSAEPSVDVGATSASVAPEELAEAPQEAQEDSSTPDLPATEIPASPEGPIQRPQGRQVIQLESGITWERLTVGHDPVDFLYVTYPVGAESCPPDRLMRHHGREYGYVIAGHLGVTVGFDQYELEPGDSICFDSTMPHRLWNLDQEPARAIWFVIGRNGDFRPPANQH